MKNLNHARLLSVLTVLALAVVFHVGCTPDAGLAPAEPEKIDLPPSASITDADDDNGDADEYGEYGDDNDDFLTVAVRDADEEGVTTAAIGPLGGVVTHGDHQLIVPAGALGATITISFSVPESDTLMFDLGPHGTQFNAPVTLVFEYDNANLTGVNEAALRVGYYNENTGVWEPMPTTVDAANDVIISQTTHFSRYAILR